MSTTLNTTLRTTPQAPAVKTGSIFLSTPVLVVAAALTVASFVVMNFQQGYPPFFTRDYRAPNDYLVYYRGAQRFLSEDNLYLDEIFINGTEHLPYSYPPTSILFFLPMLLFSEAAGWVVFSCVNAACLWWVMALTLSRCGSAEAKKWALLLMPLACWVDPVNSTMYHGQINLVLMALVATDLWWNAPSRPTWIPRGLLVGIAAAVKMIPAIFGLYFIARRDWKALATAFATGATAILVTLLARPNVVIYYFTEQTGKMRIELIPAKAHNVAASSLIARYVPADGKAFFSVLIYGAVVLVGILALRRLVRAGADEAATLCTAFMGILLPPISWQHHYVWAIPLLIVVFFAVRRTGNVWIAFIGVWYLAISTFFVPHKQIAHHVITHPDDYNMFDIFQSSYVVWAFTLLAVMALNAKDFTLSDSKDTDRD